MVLVLGLVAGLGRALQLGAAGGISRGTHLALEAVIESARLALLLRDVPGVRRLTPAHVDDLLKTFG